MISDDDVKAALEVIANAGIQNGGPLQRWDFHLENAGGDQVNGMLVLAIGPAFESLRAAVEQVIGSDPASEFGSA
jgi:hypothetical protein